MFPRKKSPLVILFFALVLYLAAKLSRINSWDDDQGKFIFLGKEKLEACPTFMDSKPLPKHIQGQDSEPFDFSGRSVPSLIFSVSFSSPY